MPITMSIVQNKLGVKSRIASFLFLWLQLLIWMEQQLCGGCYRFHCSVLWDSSHSRSISYGNFDCYTGFNRHCGSPWCRIDYVNNGLRSIGLPVEGIGLIIGVDRLLDILRTAVNVTGDVGCTDSCIFRKRFRSWKFRELTLKIINE